MASMPNAHSLADLNEADDYMTTAMQLQQLQQKQEDLGTQSVANPDVEFRRGLEELVRDTCMALASCSSAQNSDDSSSNCLHIQASTLADHSHTSNYAGANEHMSGDEHIVGHHPCNLMNHVQEQEHKQEEDRQECGYHSESGSYLSRRQSQILSRWYERQAEEVITTMERRARQAELLALAGLHTVSMLDASFLCEPSSSRSERSIEQPQRRSSLVQMWRELEDERIAERNREQSRERGDTELEAQAHRGVLTGNLSFYDRDTREDTTAESSDVSEDEFDDGGQEELGTAEQEGVLGELDNGNEEIWAQSNRTSITVDESEASPQSGEREGVREIVQRWMNEMQTTRVPSSIEHRNPGEWLDDGERERVRTLAREWARASMQERPLQQDRTEQVAIESIQQGFHLGEEHRDMQDDLTWEIRQRRDRQIILDILMRNERERRTELEGLSEHHAVSHFPYRGRLQSLLRGRFLQTGVRIEETRPVSTAASELGLLRQRRAVSGLREGFRTRLETIVRSQADGVANRSGVHDMWSRVPIEQDNIGNASSSNDSSRRDNQSQENTRNWEGMAARQMNELSLEDATAYNMELRELLGRRSVTNILTSEFRNRLDGLIRSFIQRQGRTPIAWRMPAQEQQQPQQQQVGREEEAEESRADLAPTAVPPPPPPPPPAQPLWQQDLHQQSWTGQHHPYVVWDGASELRADVVKLQQGLGDLQRMVETCVEMQLELQRSIRQEVSGALQQMYAGKAVPEVAIDGSKWAPVRKGICCVCCDKNIDSLLYRCGHMCTCSKCANKLLQDGSNCPMCRAPIVEVVRAFTIG